MFFFLIDNKFAEWGDRGGEPIAIGFHRGPSIGEDVDAAPDGCADDDVN